MERNPQKNQVEIDGIFYDLPDNAIHRGSTVNHLDMMMKDLKTFAKLTLANTGEKTITSTYLKTYGYIIHKNSI